MIMICGSMSKLVYLDPHLPTGRIVRLTISRYLDFNILRRTLVMILL